MNVSQKISKVKHFFPRQEKNDLNLWSIVPAVVCMMPVPVLRIIWSRSGAGPKLVPETRPKVGFATKQRMFRAQILLRALKIVHYCP